MALAGVAQDKPREPTLNERLNKVADSLAYQLERIESVLARVNGTPVAINKGPDLSQIKPSLALSVIVESLESINQRLADLSTDIEHIA